MFDASDVSCFYGNVLCVMLSIALFFTFLCFLFCENGLTVFCKYFMRIIFISVFDVSDVLCFYD